MSRNDVTHGRTIRDAIAMALEGIPGSTSAVFTFASPEHIRDYVLRWVHDYAIRRGVVLSDEDITSELDCIVAELRGKTLQ